MARSGGRFSLAVPEGRTISQLPTLVVVEAPGYFSESYTGTPDERQALAETGSLPELVVKLRPAVFIEGTVIDDKGRPAAGARIHVAVDPLDRHPRGGTFTTSKADGSYRLRNVDPAADLHLVAYRIAEDGTELRSRPVPIADVAGPEAGRTFWWNLNLGEMPEVALEVTVRNYRAGMKVVVGEKVVPAEEGSPVVTTVLAGPQKIELRDLACTVLEERSVDVPGDRHGFPVQLNGGD